MTSKPDDAPLASLRSLERAVDGPGIYIERGHFSRGILRSFSLRDDGYLGIVVEIYEGERHHEQGLGSVDYVLTNQWLFASGYVSWGWIFGQTTIAEIDRQIAAKGCADDEFECYKIAWTIDGRPAIIGREVFNAAKRNRCSR